MNGGIINSITRLHLVGYLSCENMSYRNRMGRLGLDISGS
jgi:hypothetical protein